MALTREQKQKIIQDLREKVEKQKVMIFVDFKGLKMHDITALKKKLKTAGAVLKVCKKTLLNIVLREKKLKADIKSLIGQIAVVFNSNDEAATAKAVYEYSKEHENLKILGGILNEKPVDGTYVLSLAQLPSRTELLGRLTFGLKAPLSNMVYALKANIKGLLVVLNAIKEKK